MSELIIITDDGPVRTVRMNRPDKKNALTMMMYDVMAAGIESAGTNSALRCLLIAGAPTVFCAGNDIGDFLKAAGEGGALGPPILRFLYALARCEKPLVAAVQGGAIGIGATMLLHCDHVVASSEARFSTPFVSLGLVPEFASSLVVPQLLGRVKASEKLLLGEPFSPAEAVEWRIANAVLPAGEVLNHARRIAERFNALPPGAVRDTKRLLQRASADQLLQAIAAENEVFGARLSGPEAAEAFSAFFQKRKPDFSTFQ